MAKKSKVSKPSGNGKPAEIKQAEPKPLFPGQVVLVFQGGGALGAYQAGVYEAFHEAGIEPDWVIGTSIGAINGAIIAGNTFDQRLPQLRAFWQRLQSKATFWPSFGHHSSFATLMSGVPGMFSLSTSALWGIEADVGAERASFYSTDELKKTLLDFVDFERLKSRATRLTVGAVSVRSGQMSYFDSRDMTIRPEEVMASSALPPAFPAIRIADEFYWDGGIYSNTPIEVIFTDYPRRSSVVFSAQLWRSDGPEPVSIRQVLDRYKDIQFASRHKSHVSMQEQLHNLRHVIRELAKRIPKSVLDTPECQDLAGWGCGTTMHILQMTAPRQPGEDLLKEMDFSSEGIAMRWSAGLEQARRTLAQKAWQVDIDPAIGVMVHDEYMPAG